jgi:mono/diheme cytochrome c family protein
MKLEKNPSMKSILTSISLLCIVQLRGQSTPPDAYMAINPRPVSTVPFRVTPERLERGRYLSEGLLLCFDCHSERDESLPGAPVMTGRKGVGADRSEDADELWAPNITPDKETGMGNWPDDALARAIREGVGHDGRALTGMPFGDFRKLSDEDVKSIVVYLRTLPPVKNKVPPRKLTKDTGKQAVMTAKPLTDPVPQPIFKDIVDRGRYLVEMAHCTPCHTAWWHRNPGYFGGGYDLYVYDKDKSKHGKIFSGNISSGRTGVGTWPPEVFIEVMRRGKAGTLDGMMPWQFYKHLNDEDLTSILAFLKTTVPVEHQISNLEPPTWCEVCEQRHGGGDENLIQPYEPFDSNYVIPWDIAGTYKAEDSGELRSISKRQGQWMISGMQDGEAINGRIVPISETKFIAEGFSHYLTFEVDSQGKVSAFNFVGLMAQRYFKK